MEPSRTTPVFSRTWPLPAGPRVRMRLARRSDHAAIRDLLKGRGLDASELEIGRLLAFDPGRRVVLCALAPLGGRESLVGLAAIDLDQDPDDAEPDTLVVDERLTEGLGELLGQVLAERVRAHARRVA